MLRLGEEAGAAFIAAADALEGRLIFEGGASTP
jgi:hypothetical protein